MQALLRVDDQAGLRTARNAYLLLRRIIERKCQHINLHPVTALMGKEGGKG
jgi:hypothetical protein